MSRFTIYHNPRCTKSRQTLALLRSHGIEPKVIEYLKNPPSMAVLRELSKKLGISPEEMVRAKEFAELKLAGNLNAQQYLQSMAKYPRTLERPIVVCGNRARIGRPPENILELLP
ncbi:MAG: arsenate reductase (glutaredoxin) [Pirellulales bacterium]|jgi:arsenate reductase|nr:arsenate reductase (glutaredoxin) [Pirellulales bacterium]